MSVSPTENWPPFRLGETFAKYVLFRPDEIRAFATMTGDTNPLHHDEDVARKSRFGRLIASGAQSTAIMASLTASLVTERCASDCCRRDHEDDHLSRTAYMTRDQSAATPLKAR
jgi:acyl dehydratase